MATIMELSKYVRSKNAGPFWTTIDIFFDNADNYQKSKTSNHLTKAAMAAEYGVKEEQVKMFFLDALEVIKISVPRPVPQGSRYERDMHSGQQYVQILGFEV